MRIAEEFKVKNDNGKFLIMQNVVTGISYLDFGMARLPRDFQGYIVKHTDQVATAIGNNTFKIDQTNEIFTRV